VTSTTTGVVNLPRTGTDNRFPVEFGASCLVVGGLLALRRRRTWRRL
jgi:LPXTG-motif cell wall-anchored protein